MLGKASEAPAGRVDGCNELVSWRFSATRGRSWGHEVSGQKTKGVDDGREAWAKGSTQAQSTQGGLRWKAAHKGHQGDGRAPHRDDPAGEGLRGALVQQRPGTRGVGPPVRVVPLQHQAVPARMRRVRGRGRAHARHGTARSCACVTFPAHAQGCTRAHTHVVGKGPRPCKPGHVRPGHATHWNANSRKSNGQPPAQPVLM
jgi:hypothetical protein